MGRSRCPLRPINQLPCHQPGLRAAAGMVCCNFGSAARPVCLRPSRRVEAHWRMRAACRLRQAPRCWLQRQQQAESRREPAQNRPALAASSRAGQRALLATSFFHAGALARSLSTFAERPRDPLGASAYAILLTLRAGRRRSRRLRLRARPPRSSSPCSHAAACLFHLPPLGGACCCGASSRPAVAAAVCIWPMLSFLAG